jgi:integrase/recombinase XerD
MSAAITLAEAIRGLVAEKRAVGYKYRSEALVLDRFEAFNRREFPGVDTLTEASVQAWIIAAQQRAVTPATLQGLAAPIRELARWLGRRGQSAYLLPRSALPRPVRYVPHIYTTSNSPRCSRRPTAATPVPKCRFATWSCRFCSA